MDLASRGRSVVVLETRRRGEPPNVKCNHVAARTMEQFRRLGVAREGARRRPAGRLSERRRLPHVGDRHRAVAHPAFPARATRYTDTSGPDGWWPTPEPPHRINQIYLEPILFAHAEAQPGVTIMNRTRGDGVRAGRRRRARRARATSTAATTCACARRYLVGCDGGRSMVRKSIGAKLAGTPVIQRVQSTYIRAPTLLGADPRRARLELLLRSTRAAAASCFAIDGHETWLVHNHLMPNEEDFEAVDRDASIRAHPRRRRRLRLRDPQQGRLDRPPPRRRSLPRRAASSSPATRRTSGCRTPATA